MDLLVEVPKFPKAGERVVADSLSSCTGGKGANQAVAAARLGADVDLVGCVGDDAWGSELRSALVTEGVDVTNVHKCEGRASGVAVVGVFPEGKLGVVVAPGGDLAFELEWVDAASEAIQSAALLVVQLEYSDEVLRRAVELARAKDVPVLLNASPARAVPKEVLEAVDLLVVDKAEAGDLLEIDEELGAGSLARRLAALGPRRVVVTQRGRKACSFDGEHVVEFDGFDVDVVDATGARDAFTGALAVAHTTGGTAESVLRSACAAGAVASSRRGALPALPSLEEHQEILKR